MADRRQRERRQGADRPERFIYHAPGRMLATPEAYEAIAELQTGVPEMPKDEKNTRALCDWLNELPRVERRKD